MIRTSIFFTACLALIIVACKSGNKELPPPPPAPAPTVHVDTSSSASTAALSASVAATAAYYMAAESVNEESAEANQAAAQPANKPGTAAPAPAPTKKMPAAAATPKPKPEVPDAQGYYEHPSKEPIYPGGQPAFSKYLMDNLKYPAAARENHIEGTVQCTLSVNEHGNIVDVQVTSQPLGYGLEEEVLRVIKGMPQWMPGEYNHHPVKVKFHLPVVFKLH